MDGRILLFIGVGAMAVAVVGGILAAIVLHSAGKRLQKQLEKEYGKPD